MKKLLTIFILLIPSMLYAASAWDSGDIKKNSNCNQSLYYSIGKLCVDTDDAKLYKGTGSAVVEISNVVTGLTSASSVAITGGTINGTSVGIKEIVVTDGLSLSAAQSTGTTINNFGQSSGITATLCPAAAELNFIASISTQHNSAFKLQRAGADTMIVDGNAAKTYITSTNMPVGSSISCRTIQTGATSYTWVCTSISGTWTTD